MMEYMNVDHLKVKGILWVGTAPTACCGERSNELVCCIKGR
jgi:hypothetical protein